MEKIMKIGFIGAGRVGGTLGRDLYQKGFDVVGYFSRTTENAEIAAKQICGIAFSNLAELIKACDFIFITVKDDAILEVAQLLATTVERFDHKFIAHTSGAHPSDLLGALADRGAAIYAIHPLQSFANVEQGLELIGNTVFSIEGSGFVSHGETIVAEDKCSKEVLRFMEEAHYRNFVMLAEHKAIYHAAAVISSNYLVATLDFALSQFERIGVDKRFAMKALFPLIQGTIDNIERLGTVEALTGPIARGDVKTVEKHLSKLSGEDAALYKALGRRALDIATEKGLAKAQRDQLFNRLKED